MKSITLYNIEFIEQLQSFNIRLRQQGRKKNNLEEMVSHVKEYLAYLEMNCPNSSNPIVQRNIDNFFKWLAVRPNQRKDGTIGTSYINKYREAVMRFVEFLLDKECGGSHIHIKRLKVDKEPVEVLSEQEIQELYKACDNSLIGISNRFILSMLYGCGLRKDELYQLEVSDFDMSKGLIRLDETKTKFERDVVMTPNVQRAVEEYLYTARNSMLPASTTETHALVTYQGRRMSKNTIPFRVKTLANKAKVFKRIYAHLFRHSIGTHLLIQGLTLQEIADFLGHNSLDATMIYTHLKHQLI